MVEQMPNSKSSSIAFVLALIFITGISQTGFAQGKNSSRKIRVKPSKTAAKIGTAIKWEKSFADAKPKSEKTNKPIFWYVPTLRGTFMDRKPVIDRYMLAGPFSWPVNIDTINHNFIPFRGAPTRAQQKDYELVPFKFVEPGFVVLKPDGSVKHKVDQITTMSTEWMTAQFKKLGCDIQQERLNTDESRLWNSLVGSRSDNTPKEESGKKHSTRYLLLKGMLEFRKGNHAAARENWKAAAKAEPDNPLAWKAAAEAEGFGPFVRGFETFRPLAAEAREFAGIKSRGTTAPPNSYSEEKIWRASANFLLGMQRSDGGWVDSDYDFGGTDSLPNVHVAVTALCGMGLLEFNARYPKNKRVQDAIRKAAKFVMDEKNLNRDDTDEILWAIAFRTRFMARLLMNDENYRDQLFKSAADLQKLQSGTGHWFHEYPNPFVTATALAALQEAKIAGFNVDTNIAKKGVAALGGDRFENGAFSYIPGRPSQPKPAAGRMPLCESALALWGASSKERLNSAVEFSMEHHDKTLKSAFKYDDHTSNMSYGGFFFWYDMRARSEAISMIEDDAVRGRLQKKQKEIVLSVPEIDGCFVDSHELGRCYGTAMALLTLSRCED